MPEEPGEERKGNSDEEDDISKLLRVLNVSSLGDAIQVVRAQQATIVEQEEKIETLTGRAFCTLDDVMQSSFEECLEEHFTSLCRDWNNRKITNSNVLKVYDRTRAAALDDETKVSATKTLMSLKGNDGREIRPVRVCSHRDTENYAEKAHLCPKSGAIRQVDTWIYAAAAVLGMECDSVKNRMALLKSLRGCVKVGSSQALPLSGLNRSPFNLLSFLGQETWFDINPGVVVLPCLYPNNARDWDGNAYSIIILGNHVPAKATADDIAVNIGLTRTPLEHLHKATEEDITKAFLLLKQVVLASAYCLSTKEGPDTEEGRKLWKLYKDQLQTNRSGAHSISGNPVALKGVTVPKLHLSGEGKFVAKIDLGEMTPPVPESNPAIPDPLQLAYKSSVNWTRKYGFQLMAEAEPHDDECTIFPDIVVHSDQDSKSSVYTSLGPNSA